ncbi:hypothetical protein CK485_00140 [Streptomyces sp. ICBB 8177]|nr:hypothetical protein CK485_00140 [Streptomyces sp. ICBB 8177]
MTDLRYLDCIRPLIAVIGPQGTSRCCRCPCSADARRPPAEAAALGMIGTLIPEPDDALPPGRIQYASEAPHLRGRLRLLGGMVRVNRPWPC